MISPLGTTLTQHIVGEQRLHPEAKGDFTNLMQGIVTAAKIISKTVRRAGLVDIMGMAGSQNIYGEDVQKLDLYSDKAIVNVMNYTGQLGAMASEENDDLIHIPDEYPHIGKYVLAFDPLDGSSNICANATIGTIFSVHKRITTEGRATEEDFLQIGRKQVCAGYVVYGSSTLLVYTTGHGVHGFTLDPSVGEFLLSHPNMRIPTRGTVYSANEGNFEYWDKKDQELVRYFKTLDKETGRPYSLRYIGTLVADFHRNLLTGGLFMYPADNKKSSNTRGKLRLLFEAAPLAMIAEQAGGGATDGRENILDITPEQIHQKVPLYIGSKEDVDLATRFVSGQN